jgi:hypothetical protein
MISRRYFQTMLIAAGLSAGAAGLMPRVAMSATPLRTYRYRCRCAISKDGKLNLWMRVKNIVNLDASVPFQIVISTDQAQKHIVASGSYLSETDGFHIVRASLATDRAGGYREVPLYYKFLLGPEKTMTQPSMWKPATAQLT